MNHQLLRFEKPIATLEALLTPEALAADKLDATLDEIVKRDARGRLFALEGLLRIYDAIQPSLAPHLGPIKEAEDAIGHYTERVEYLDYAKALEAPGPVLEVLTARAQDGRERLREQLAAMPATLAALRRALDATHWLGEAEDAEAVLAEIARELRRYAKKKYDLRELQSGVHELRRNLRWFLVYVQALDGLVLLERARGPIKLNAYSYLETHPIAQSRFSKVPANLSLGWVTQISNAYFLALSKIVNELGEVKSHAEAVEAMAEAFEETNALDGAEKAVELARRQPNFIEDWPRAARRVKRELDETRLLSVLRKELRRNLRESSPAIA